MFPLKTAFISPHPEGAAIALRLKLPLRLSPRLPYEFNLSLKDIISIGLTILGITVISGVCYLTSGLAHPIFAYEGDYVSFRTRAEILTKEEIEQRELEEWTSRTNYKYRGQLVSRPAKGVVHVKTTKWINNRPVKVNIVEINQKANSNLQIKPKTASEDVLNRKATIRNIARTENSIVAINGGYFKPQTGVPLGTLVIDKNVLTGPVYNRVALGINSDNSFSMDKSTIDITLRAKKLEIKADNINQPRMLSTYTLVYTEKWGKMSPPAPKYGMAISIKDGQISGHNFGSIEIPKGGYAVVGPRQKIEPLLSAKNIALDINFSETFEKSEHIIGGGPYLVKNGQMYVDIKEQRFGAINGKNPRTAIGYTENNELIIVTVDGREETSVGMTLWEISRLMKDLGCKYAMNLDGGGSSVIYVKGKIENRPAYKEGIAISNAIVVNEIQAEAETIAVGMNETM